MSRPEVTSLFLVLLAAVCGPACHAQSNTPQNAALGKKACDYVTKADAESILGQPLTAAGDGVFECTKDVPGFGDAAIWLSVGGTAGTLLALKGGTVSVILVRIFKNMRRFAENPQAGL